MELVLLLGICYGVVYLLTGIVFLSCVVYGGIVLTGLSLLQWIIGLVIEGVTGEKPDWLFSEASFNVEVLLIAALIDWLKDVKAELAKPQPPMLNDLLALHCANRNKGAYSNKAKNANLQRYAEAFSFLQGSASSATIKA